MNTSYKQMLRNRCPEAIDKALKFCKAKELWLDHVYNNFIWIYASKKDRLDATKRILGLKNNRANFNFAQTIDWNNLSKEDVKFWKSVEYYVDLFKFSSNAIRDHYLHMKSWHMTTEEIKLNMIKKFLMPLCPLSDDPDEVRKRKNANVNALCDYLIDWFES